MKKVLKFFVFMGILHLGMITAGMTAETTLDEARIREIVKEVIEENPKLIYDSVNEYVRQQREEKEAAELEASFKNRITDVVLNEKNPVNGLKDAPITIIEYSDFQCPYCKRGADTMTKILKKYSDKVRLVFKNNPLDFHKEATPAAAAALAAHKQGKFWEYHDLLFKNSSGLNEDLFIQFAKDLKLDLEKFNKDRNSEEITKQVEDEKAEAEIHGLRGTPTFLVNGVVVRGAKGNNHFEKLIERLLSEKKPN